MRICPECGTQVAPLVDIDGTDHYVLLDGPLSLDVVDSDANMVRFVASQDVRISTCNTVMDAAKLRAADLLDPPP